MKSEVSVKKEAPVVASAPGSTKHGEDSKTPINLDAQKHLRSENVEKGQ